MNADLDTQASLTLMQTLKQPDKPSQKKCHPWNPLYPLPSLCLPNPQKLRHESPHFFLSFCKIEAQVIETWGSDFFLSSGH